ncbi:cytochrome C [Paraburkholderia monticola]|uniref:Cytochrome C n=1 Tax=Paraburkholderia monticola TaxID=1399968 RepID=A0A149PIN4_9BURK|nr:c-type cytochrome [Paraburkholderia monticola]KXU84925.1 cytochrome C [Paraburkholderia monticola]
MKGMPRWILLATLLGDASCHDLEHSRRIDDPAVTGRTIALQVCSNCHGVGGVSVSPIFPKLAGQQKEYLVNQLMDFRAHRRSDPNAKRYMWGFTHLSDAQIEQLATYFSSRPPPEGDAGDPLLVANGKVIFMSGLPDKGVPACSACHGAHGEGVGEFPRLAGQYADYLVKQLVVFQHAEQRPRGDVMNVICVKLTEQEMHSVAAFLEASAAAQ